MCTAHHQGHECRKVQQQRGGRAPSEAAANPSARASQSPHGGSARAPHSAATGSSSTMVRSPGDPACTSGRATREGCPRKQIIRCRPYCASDVMRQGRLHLHEPRGKHITTNQMRHQCSRAQRRSLLYPQLRQREARPTKTQAPSVHPKRRLQRNSSVSFSRPHRHELHPPERPEPSSAPLWDACPLGSCP